MKLNPQQAPLYGECLLTLQLCDEDRFCDDEDVEFYLLFAGSTQRHVTSTLRVSHVTLQAICPAHNCCESVRVTLCSARPGGPVSLVAEDGFQFVQDLALDMARFLVNSAGRDDWLDGAMLLDECQIPLRECERLDKNLALALRHLALPKGWSVLGTDWGRSLEPAPQETLLHFAARRGLRHVAVFLLQQPGGREALRLPNQQGVTPLGLAEKRGHRHLQQIFAWEEAALGTRVKASQQICLGERMVWHHPRLNTYTLTLATPPGSQPDLQRDVDELQHLIGCHRDGRLQPDLNYGMDHSGKTDPVKAELLLEPLQQDLPPDQKDRSVEEYQDSQEEPSDGVEGRKRSLNNGSMENGVSGKQTDREAKQCSTCLENSGKVSEERDSELKGERTDLSILSYRSELGECDSAVSVTDTGLSQSAQTGEETKEVDENAAGNETENTGERPVGLMPPNEPLVTADGERTGHFHETEVGDVKEAARSGDIPQGMDAETDRGVAATPPRPASVSLDDVETDGSQQQVSTASSKCPSLLTDCENLGKVEARSETCVPDQSHEVTGVYCNTHVCSGHDQSDCTQSCSRLETGASESAESVDRVSAHFVEPEPICRHPGLMADESHCTDQQFGQLDRQFLPEPTGVVWQDPADMLHVEPQDRAPHEEPQRNKEGPTEGLVVSVSSLEGAGDNGSVCMGDRVGNEDLRRVDMLCGEEDALRAVSGPVEELLCLPEVGITMELIDQIPANHEGELLVEDVQDNGAGTKEEPLLPGSEMPTEGSNKLQTEQSLTLESTKFSSQSLSNEDTMGTLCRRPYPDASCLALSIDSRIQKGNKNNCELTRDSEEPELKWENQEGQESPLRSEVTGTLGSTETQGSELHVEGQAATGIETEMIVKADSEPKEGGESVDTERMVSDFSETQLTTQDSAVSVTCNRSEPQSTQLVSEEPMEETTGSNSEVRPQQTHAEDIASRVSTSSVHPSDGVVPLRTPRTSAEAVPQSPSGPEDCDSTYLSMGEDLLSLTEPTSDSALGPELSDSLPRVDEDSEDQTERKARYGDEGPQTTPEDEGGPPDQPATPSPALGPDTGGAEGIHRETDLFYSFDACPAAVPLGDGQSGEAPGSPPSVARQRASSSTFTSRQDSCGAADGFGGSTAHGGSVIEELEAVVTVDSREFDVGPTGSSPEAEEEKDRLTEVPPRSAIVLRSSARSISPVRRHSWGPGRNGEGEAEMSQRSPLRSPGDRRPTFHKRSYSLEGLTADRDGRKDFTRHGLATDPGRTVGPSRLESEERGSLVSLTEEEHESDLGDCSSLDSQMSGHIPLRSCSSANLPLTKSVSMLAISQKELDGLRSFSSISGSLAYSISEEDPGPLRGDGEGKPCTKVSRTFSYIRNKMYKKTKEKDKEKNREKEREAKEKEKKNAGGHVFGPVSTSMAQCLQCNRTVSAKDAVYCPNCSTYVHKSCRESLPACPKVKMMQRPPFAVPDASVVPVVTLRSKGMAITARDRPWSVMTTVEDHSLVSTPRRHASVTAPPGGGNLSKSVSISNIAGSAFDDVPLKGLKFLSHSTDSLNKTGKVNESMESLTDEGTEMMDSQLMGEFEADTKDLEADSWSFSVDKKFLKHLKKDVIKRQDVIYELIQTEMHHVRTLRIMWNVYSKGMQREVQLDGQTVERIFPMLDDLLDVHTHFFANILDRKREARQDGGDGGFVIHRIGDVLVNQFSGSNAERMKKVYGKFCSRHNEAVNFYKELHAKDKRFQAFIKKKMSSSIVRRLGIPECILLVTQRITKYPVLLQRILQHTKESEEDHREVGRALQLVKEVIAAVDSKVNEHEKKRRLREVYSRTDSKSIMRMKSGQMFAREDLLRGRKLLHDGPLQLKTSVGRLKDIQAILLSDVFVFLQEKDQKYVFASLDQRSTVISLQKLIVREVANEEKGLFLITAGKKPEMVEVYASSKEERNTWMQLIQEAMNSMEKDEDEGIPSEPEEDKRLLETKAKEMRELLRKKDEQIVALLEEKVKLFGELCENPASESPAREGGMLFRAGSEGVLKGEPVLRNALKEVENLHMLVSSSLAVALGQQVASSLGSAGPGTVCLPRRAETFGGFDSHQMNTSKSGEKDEAEDSTDLRRTESDSVLKKEGNANLLLLLKRNSEQVLHSVGHLHELLSTLQAVVVQQDTLVEDQRQVLSERPPSRPGSRPPSLVDQERQRHEAAELQRRQAAHTEERLRQGRLWEAHERELAEREARVLLREDEAQRRRHLLDEEERELQERKAEYQRDLERLRDSQRKLERDREQLHRDLEALEQRKQEDDSERFRTLSSTSEDSLRLQSCGSLDTDPLDGKLSSSPKDSMSRMGSKRKGKNFNPFASNPEKGQKAQSSEAPNQIPSRLLQLAKPKEKKDKKKKKGKGPRSQSEELPQPPSLEPSADGEIFFC